MKTDLNTKFQVRNILEIIERVAQGKNVELYMRCSGVIKRLQGQYHLMGTQPDVVALAEEITIIWSRKSIYGKNSSIINLPSPRNIIRSIVSI